MDEQRRYFPDWIECLPASLPELEADHNSYLAGGYAEEFGYRAQLEYSRDVAVLDGPSPDLSSERFAQAQAIHPGYPLKPHPLAAELDDAHDGAGVYQRHVQRKADAGHPGTVIIVSQQLHARKRRQVVQRMTLVPIRLTSAVMLLRWVFGRRYRASQVDFH
jgi:hypothetical protein